MNQDNLRAARAAVLIEDDWRRSRAVESLQAAGVSVELLRSRLALPAVLERQSIDAVLIEDRRDELLECLEHLRFQGLGTVPVIAIGSGTVQRITDALRHGAADYVCTTDAAELLAHRVIARIALARQPAACSSLHLGELVLDASCRALRCPAGEVPFTTREFALAWMLFERVGEVVNLQMLARRIWGREASLAKRTIEQHISRVRHKLSQAGASAGTAVQLHAIHNIGYRLTHAPRARAGMVDAMDCALMV